MVLPTVTELVVTVAIPSEVPALRLVRYNLVKIEEGNVDTKGHSTLRAIHIGGNEDCSWC